MELKKEFKMHNELDDDKHSFDVCVNNPTYQRLEKCWLWEFLMLELELIKMWKSMIM